MTVKSAPFYWLTCDHVGCNERCPSPDSEFMAWADAEQAVDAARDSDWSSDDDGDYCPEHEHDRVEEGA